jgi:hypothetical protein
MAQIPRCVCERALSPKASFDRRSFRYKRSGRAWVLIGCPRGQWNARAERCRVGTRAYKLLTPAPARGRCASGQAKACKRGRR